jgi:hypothetical protein
MSNAAHARCMACQSTPAEVQGSPQAGQDGDGVGRVLVSAQLRGIRLARGRCKCASKSMKLGNACWHQAEFVVDSAMQVVAE